MYDYRLKPYDEYKNPENEPNAYFNNAKPKDKSDRVEYDFDLSPTLLVPRDWNSQEDKLFYYEGTVWYQKSFDYVKAKTSNRLFLYLGAVNYEADVYLNGKKLGKHIGGFTAFNYEITDIIREKGNNVVVKVDNKRRRDGVPTLNTDWWNYGGITRDVKIVETPSTFIQDYFIQLKKGSTEIIEGYVVLNGKDIVGKQVTVSIPQAKITTTINTDATGTAKLSISAKKLNLWSCETPFLYDVKLSYNKEELKDQIGFRTIETKGSDILLNGKSVFLRGICIHEENCIRGGRAFSMEDAQMLLGWAKELNCNFVRLAHYQHNENMVRLADKLGLLVWEENPVYWTIQWENPATFDNARNQLTEEITRDKNRASVIIWSMANETPLSDARLDFLRRLTQHARSLDNTRLISAALEYHAKPDDPNTRIIGDPFAKEVDVLGFNEYIGWYSDLPNQIARAKFDIQFDKPVVISEFGADALQGLHGDSLTRWTEEFQEYLYKETIDMLSKIPQFRGVTPWIIADFRSPRRVLPVIQDGWNRKGLIGQTGTKKKAFMFCRSFIRIWN